MKKQINIFTLWLLLAAVAFGQTTNVQKGAGTNNLTGTLNTGTQTVTANDGGTITYSGTGTINAKTLQTYTPATLPVGTATQAALDLKIDTGAIASYTDLATGTTGKVIDADQLRFNDLKRKRALRRWWYAVGDRADNPADVVLIGDSITAGYQLDHADAWWPQVRDGLRAKYPVAGVVGGRGYYSPSQAISTPADWPVVTSGGSLSSTQGLGLKSWALNAGNTLTLTTGDVTSVNLRYFRNTLTGTFSWAVDGGSATNVNTVAGGTSDFNTTTISGLGGTSHTIVITGVSGLVLFDGFQELNGDEASGIRVWESAKSSVSSTSFSANTVWYDAFTSIQPDLVVIELGANDAFGTNPPNSAATYKAAILSIISSIRAKTTVDPSIVLCPVWAISPSGGVTPVGTWNDYVAAMYEIAAADDEVCIFDVRQYFRTSLTVDTAGGLLGDTAHPAVEGSQLYAGALVEFLSAPIEANYISDGSALVTLSGVQTLTNKKIRTPVVTVATLPVSPVAGEWSAVSDALAPTYGATVVGGGAIVTPVWYDGTNWTCR